LEELKTYLCVEKQIAIHRMYVLTVKGWTRIYPFALGPLAPRRSHFFLTVMTERRFPLSLEERQKGGPNNHVGAILPNFKARFDRCGGGGDSKV
jgi:hypothetical protein